MTKAFERRHDAPDRRSSVFITVRRVVTSVIPGKWRLNCRKMKRDFIDQFA